MGKTKTPTIEEEGLEFLPAALEIAESPPRALGRIVAIVIGVFFVLVIVWAAFSPIDIVAVAEGRVVPTGQIKVLQSSQSGVVTTILVGEGDSVQDGQILITLDDTEAKTNRSRVELELSRAQLDRAVTTALLSENPAASFRIPQNVDQRLVELSKSIIQNRWDNYQSSLDDNEAEHLGIESSISAFQAEETANQESVTEFIELNEAATKLDAVGLTTRSQMANLRLQLISVENQLQNITHKIAQAKLELTRNEAQRSQIISAYLSQVNAELAAARQSILIASEEIVRLKERETLFQLRSPVSGTVNEINIHTIGAVVSASETLLTIVPEGVLMEIEATLENRDVGFVTVGQDAEIKLEAFPFTRFGVIDGSVTHISPDAVVDPSRGLIYTIRVAPASQVHKVNNQEIYLSSGMRSTVEIKTGKRTVLEFFLAPLLRYKDEAIRER